MNVGAFLCAIMAVVFCIIALIFWKLGEKGAILVSGFNSLPKDKQEQYDKKRISEDQRKLYTSWMALFIAGTILCFLVSSYVAIAALAVWLVLFFRQVHLYPEKAFEKYKKT